MFNLKKVKKVLIKTINFNLDCRLELDHARNKSTVLFDYNSDTNLKSVVYNITVIYLIQLSSIVVTAVVVITTNIRNTRCY